MRKALFSIAALACIAATSIVPKPGLKVEGPTGAIAPRDSLTYTLRWGRAQNATGYRVTVSASPGATSGLPSNVATPDTFYTFTAINLVYDSLRFLASVSSVRGSQTNPNPATAAWFVKKLPGAPGPILIDSSAVPAVTKLDVIPSTATLVIGQTLQGCAFFRFANGQIGMRSVDGARCLNVYLSKYSAAQRALSCQMVDWLDGSSTCPVGSFARYALSR